MSAKLLRSPGTVLRACRESFRRLPLRLVVARRSEKVRSSNAKGQLRIEYEDKKVPILLFGARASNYRSVYQIVSGRKADASVVARWQSLGVERYEVHGHSVAAYDSADRKVAELLVSANVSTRMELALDASGCLSPRVRMDVPGAMARVSILESQFVIADRRVGDPRSGWRSWQNDIRLSYLLEPPATFKGAESLTVVFSALSADYDFTYNYRSALDGSDSYRLFLIDDFGSRGSYYFADHRDTVIYEDVQKFLKEIIEQLGITLEHVVFAGSSKGGTAALLHGIAMGVGRVVIGAPQIYVGSYLHATAPEVLGFIAGGRGQDAKKWLDRAIYKRITAVNENTDVCIIVGAKDHHLSQHVKPLLDVTASAQYNVKALVVQDVAHSDIGAVYRHYLKNMVDREPGDAIDAVIPHEICLLETEPRTIKVTVWRPENELVACHLYGGQVLIEKRGYTYETHFIFTDVTETTVRFRFYRKQPGDADPFAQFYSKSMEL